MITIIQSIISAFIELATNIFNYVFEGVDFSVLWNWLPQDIQTTAASFIVILFAIALINGVRKFLPF